MKVRDAFLSFLFCFLLYCFDASAQSASNPEMADAMRSNGKIYVVVLTVLMVFLGILAFLFFLEKRVSKLEKNIKNK